MRALPLLFASHEHTAHLRKYNYLPDLQEKAVQTEIDQAKLLAENLIKDVEKEEDN